MSNNIEVRNDSNDDLDEIVAANAYVHLERMDGHWFCLIIEQGDRRLLVNVGAKSPRAKVRATIYADEKAQTNG